MQERVSISACMYCVWWGEGEGGWNNLLVVCCGLTVLLDLVSRVRSSFSGRRDFSLGADLGSDSIPPKLSVKSVD